MQNFVNAPHRGDTRGAATGAPNAALLIDFDNVTMGIRSDLTRQMKDLLSSDIIRGKVAVQRAYADWRRYAQYIVPLSEASVDLIFAPAYGSSKKNATDIRLAIDALELVFTRPEIGTYILLSGDSDFSSLVLKLKEYGKYVIGVGLRESASDLLVQNCDEYFSYSSLTGLTRAGEEETVSAIDPWELVEQSVNRMADGSDVMRSDRLKQVMLDLDPNFDEAEIGYSKFNKFLAEAASRNRLALKKLGNGQYEVQPLAEGGAPAREEKSGRGRRDESRGRGRKRPEPPKEIVTEKAPSREAARAASKPRPEPKTRDRREEDVDHGYELLKRAIRALIEQSGEGARDSDIKRKMLELEPGWDEAELGFTKFSRFLRQAHAAEVIDLQRTSEGYYEATLPSDGAPAGAEREPRREAPAERPKREAPSDRAPRRESAEKAPSAPRARAEAPRAEATEKAEVTKEEPKPEPTPQATPTPKPQAKPEPKATPQAKSEPTPPAKPEARAEAPKPEAGTDETAARKPAGTYGRRDRRPKADKGPPPLLPGQAVGGTAGGAAPAAEQPKSEGTAAPKSEGAAAPKSEGAAAPKAEAKPEVKPAETGPQPKAEAAPGVEKKAAQAAPQEAPGAPEFDADELGLPTDAGAVIRYLSNSYQGVGQKTAEALIEVFGEARVFNGLNRNPEKVREVLGSGRRTEILLDAWQRDYRRRTTAGAGDKQPVG